MKKMIFTLLAVITGCIQAQALSVERSREEARFLTDKMAYELDLTDDQIQDVYEINYDYFRSLGPVDKLYDSYYNRRYQNLRYVLYGWQWNDFIDREYFLRPAFIYRGGWVFRIYNYYHQSHFYFGIPACYHHYHGGHYNRPTYYRKRVDLHRRAMAHRPRPVEHRRPQMTRPNHPNNAHHSPAHNQPQHNRPGNTNVGRPSDRNNSSTRPQHNTGTPVRNNGSRPSSTRTRTDSRKTQVHQNSRTEKKQENRNNGSTRERRKR